ncbi:replication restart DNA helicase PriA [Orbus hercynius]|uniref:Replication restart protein PriA n=1 Tax=Orbus hercynius TaxID=593135 RepID=A0A495REN7_9GAMM|nr:primosomal protein N' [Orbus hercynius]RKS85942.1 replication restart DNA helicase PriA [Orbus hercynius]
MLIAQVALPIRLHQVFDYLVPDDQAHLVMVGQRVKVPFGKRHAIGIITNTSAHSEFDIEKLKSIDEIIDECPLFSAQMWQFLRWAADYYHYPLGEVLFHAIPVLLRQGRPAAMTETLVWQLTEQGKNVDSEQLSRSKKQQTLLRLMQKQQSLDATDFSPAVYHGLCSKGLIAKVAITTAKNDWQQTVLTNPSPFALNAQQYDAIMAIAQQLNHFAAFLLDGVTGSGKTEVYLNAIQAVIEQGKQALVLVPEIGLTPQTIARFKQRFNVPIAILHSAMSEKVRLSAWLQCQNGEIAIVVGTRSALFSPFKNLGMIIIDEEHDGSYKQQEGWRYHARDLAMVRAKIENVPIILGSATPSLETLNNAKLNRYQHLMLTERAGDAKLAKQTIFDIKGLVLSAGLSQPLINQIKVHLANNNQVMLFLNRRGFAPLLICHDCGWIAECPRCDRPYTYHQKQHKLICHHCDTPRTIPDQCPKCGSTHLVPIGFGTEQLEKHLNQLFPDVPVSRIDRDSISKKGALEQYLQAINQGGKHILVGTQILAKGHHFADVTLVGIVDVDGALFSSDFRATERFAQIYTQVSGRAGRENKAGEVILQTYHPDHPLLNVLLQQGYQAFAQQALQERQMTLLPPFSYQALIHAADRNNQYAPQFLHTIVNWLNSHFTDQSLWLLGPAQANQAKKAGYHRWHLLLQHPQRAKLQSILHELVMAIESWPEAKNLRWSIDVDPLDVN